MVALSTPVTLVTTMVALSTPVTLVTTGPYLDFCHRRDKLKQGDCGVWRHAPLDKIKMIKL